MKILIAFTFLISLSLVNAQTISDEIGSVSCEFALSSNGTHLEVKKQLLTQRAEGRTEVSHDENRSYGLGLGYTEWHLEFVTTNPIITRPRTSEENGSHRDKYYIQLLDKDNNLLMKTYLTADLLRLWQGGTSTDPLYTYSLDLIRIPLILLDDVAYLDISLIE